MISSKEDLKRISDTAPFSGPDNVPFVYKIGRKTYRGIPEKFNPKVEKRVVDSNLFQYIIRGKTSAGLEITAECKQYRDYPVTEWVMYFTNGGTGNSLVIDSPEFVNEFEGEKPVLCHGNGDTCGEDGYEWFEDRITKSKLSIYPAETGLSCQGAFPYMRLRFKDWGVNIAIGWSGRWKADFRKTGDRVLFKSSQYEFKSYLKPGETARTPSVILEAYAGDDDKGRNLWRSWYFDHVLPKQNGEPLKPKLVLHTWLIDGLPEFCGVTEENQIKAINSYIEGGIKPDIWWIDAGWYNCNNNWPLIGTWKPHKEHFPDGFNKLGRFVENKDIDLLVWFEPERVYKDTEIWNEHPNFLLKLKREANDWEKSNALFDMGNPEARKWMTDRIDGIVKDAGLKIYRQDFNYNPGPIWKDNEEEGRVGILENLHIQGYYAYWDELIERNPGLIMDSCASGGRRNDIETMKRAVPLHYTDVGYGNHLVKQKQHREMFEWIPYFRAHTFNWDNPDGTYGGSRPIDDFAYQNAMTPAITSMIEWNDSKDKFAIGLKNHPVWRKAAEIELSADYYPLTKCKKDPKDWYAMQFDGRVEGFVQVIRNIQVTEDSYKVKPYVSKEDFEKTYVFTDMLNNETFEVKGSKLAKSGFTATVPQRTGRIWFYVKK